MRILTVIQGRYGQRITDNIRLAQVPGWTVASWRAPQVLPPVIDYPEEYLPATLDPADLVISLGEHPGVAELLPDIVTLCGAREVLVPVDNVAWLPPGLMRQLARWLADLDVLAVFPKPFCSLTPETANAYRRATAYTAPLIAEFARHFGKPVLHVDVDAARGCVADVRVLRDTPCGCAHHVAGGLHDVAVDDAVQTAGMLHHHFPCLGGMAIDPDYSDTLMHVSGHILQDEVNRQVRDFVTPPTYLRPQGRSA